MAEEVLIEPNGKSRGVSRPNLFCILGFYYNNNLIMIHLMNSLIFDTIKNFEKKKIFQTFL